MEEKLTKTSTKQRIFILIIAIVMLGSIIASYIAIVLSGDNTSSSNTSVNQALISELTAKYEAKNAEVDAAAANLSSKYFTEFSGYQSEVKAYNEATANSEAVSSRDLKVGDGRELSDNDQDYFAYYIGWCADETIFDSSLDGNKLKAPLSAGVGLIDGWYAGMAGARLGGVREITIPGELAYGESREICGGKNKPLKFIVMPIERTEPLATLSDELNDITMRLQYAYYGIDYDNLTVPEGE